MALTVQELQAVFGLDTGPFDKSLGGLKGKIGRVGPVLAGAAGVAGAGVAAALAGAIERGRVQDRMAAQLGLAAPAAAEAGRIAGNLYKNAYGDSLQGVSDAVAAVMSSMPDLPTDQVEAVTAAALDMASAFEVDVARSTQVVGQMIRTGMVPNATAGLDLLTTAMQKVPAAVREDLLDATDEYGPFFQAVGISGENAMGMLVKASEKGMYGIDKTGDAVKEFSIRATDMSAASKVAYDTLGMSQEDMTNKLLAGGDTARGAFQQIVGGLQGIKDPAAQSQAALALFGTPLEDLSVTEMPRFLSSLTQAESGLGNVDGAAKRMGDTLNDNAATNLEAFKRQASATFVDLLGGRVLPIAENVAGALATRFGPALRDVAGVVRGDVVPALRDGSAWLQDNARVIGIVAGIVAAVMIPHYAALGAAAVASRVKQVAAWVATQAGAARAAVVHSGAVARMVAGWVFLGAQSLVQGARMAAAWVLAMGPVGWVIAGVVALTALVIANWDTIVKYTRRAWTWVTDKVGDAWDWVTRKTGDATTWLVRTVTGWVVSTTTRVTDLRDRVVGAVTGLWERTTGLFRDGIRWVVGAVLTFTVEVLRRWYGLRDGAAGAAAALRDRAVAAFTGLRDRGVAIVTGLRDTVLGRARGLRDAVVGVFWNLRDGATNAFRSVRDNITNLMDGIRAGAARPVNFVIDTVYNGGIRGVVNSIASAIGSDKRLARIEPIKTRATGGYTPKGMTLVGEQGPELVDFGRPGRVYTAKQTRAMQSGGEDFERPNRGTPGRTIVTHYQRALARHGSLRVRDEAPGHSVAAAARQWDGIIPGLSVRAGSGAMQSVARAVNSIPGYPSAIGLATYATGAIQLKGAGRSSSQRKRTTMHEIGHVLGLLHPSSGVASAMKQSGSGGAMAPTEYDRRSLASLYKVASDADDPDTQPGLAAKLLAGLITSAPGKAGIGAAGWVAGNFASLAAKALNGVLGSFPASGFLGGVVKDTGGWLVDKVIGFARSKDEAAPPATPSGGGGGGGGGGPLPPVVGGWMRPIRGGRITSEFGMRRHPISGRTKLHNGIDVSTGGGAGIYAMQAGRVTQAGRVGSYGNFVQIAHANGYKTGYAHLSRILTSVGASVGRGARIGTEGATGGVTGAHLHQNVTGPGGGWINPRRLGVYDTGGWLPTGFSMSYNGTGKAERIRTAEQEADVQRRLKAAESSGGPAPLIGSLTMSTLAQDPRAVVDELSHELRVIRRGGRYTAGAR